MNWKRNESTYVPLPGYIHREICSEFSLEFQSLSSSTEGMFIDLILDLVGERENERRGKIRYSVWELVSGGKEGYLGQRRGRNGMGSS